MKSLFAKFSKIPYVLLSVFLFATSCVDEGLFETVVDQQEETDIDFKTVSFGTTKDFLERLKNSRTYKTANPIGLEIDESSLRHVDIQNTDQKITILDASTKFKNVQSHIFQIEIDGGLQTVLYNEIEDKVASKGNAFTGKIVVTDLQGIVLDRHFIDAGIYIGSTDDPCWGIACGITLDEVVVTPSNNNNFIPSNGFDQSGLGKYGWKRHRNRYSSMGLAYGAYYRSKALRKFDESIDDSDLKPCMKKILTDLKTVNNGIGSIIGKFSESQWEIGFNWDVKDGNLGGANGQTKANYSRLTKTVTTIFDSSLMENASDLSVARTILHESVHAYIVASFGVDYAGAQKTFSEVFEDFDKNRFDKDLNRIHHAEITRNFVNDIAASITRFGLNRGYDLSSEFYHDLAWGGLTDQPKRNS